MQGVPESEEIGPQAQAGEVMETMNSDLGMDHQPLYVWELLHQMGVGPVAVEWAKPFGTDLRKMWRSCEHGELMIGIACQAQAPSILTTLAALECVDFSLPGNGGTPPEAINTLDTIYGWVSDDAEDGDVAECVGMLDIVMADYAKTKDVVGLRALQSAHAVGAALLHSNHGCSVRRQASIAALRQASELCIEIVRATGETSDNVLRGVGLSALNEFAVSVRNYVPVEIVAMSGFCHALGELQISVA